MILFTLADKIINSLTVEAAFRCQNTARVYIMSQESERRSFYRWCWKLRIAGLPRPCRLLTVTFVVFSHAALRSVWTQSNQSATLIWYQHLCSLWASQDSLLQCSPTQSSSGWVKETLFISRWRGEVQNTHHRPLKKNQATLCLLMHQLAHKCSGSIAAFFLSLLPLISSKLR